MNLSKHILIASTNTKLTLGYASQLEPAGYSVSSYTDGRDVLQAALDHRPALILLDLDLYNLSAHDLIDIIRHTPETAHTKIIILTTIIDPAIRTRFAALGVTDVAIASPTNASEVIARIHHHLGTYANQK